MNLDFLKSRRFWCLIGVAIVGVLGSEGILPTDIVKAISIVLLGFIGVRTIDKASEAIAGVK